MVLQKPAHSNTGNLGNCASSKTVLLSPGQRCVRVRLALKCFEMQPDIHSWCNIKSCTNPWCSVRVIGKDAVSSSKVLVGFGISLHPCTLLSLSASLYSVVAWEQAGITTFECFSWPGNSRTSIPMGKTRCLELELKIGCLTVVPQHPHASHSFWATGTKTY